MTDDASDIIVKLKDDHQQVMERLDQASLPSLEATVDDIFKKFLLLCGASYCEGRMTEILVNLYKDSCGDERALSTFVQKQALERQYFKLFDWESRNANKLFDLFGIDFKKHMQKKVNDDRDLDESIRAFLELGSLRNQAVHENLATFSLDKNADDVFELYQKTDHFLRVFSSEIRQFVRGSGAASSMVSSAVPPIEPS